ncbi:hypothetical protein BCR35DRAFT_64420 [Leucosporidium creatinivorum]|uniref:SUZ domain-containing protein n=1 Tax=Leucosporidium creatinivorum TaxID=106004 RepID=A0A1Y2FHS4_9BASI|nr:hypothetical protein BCR35DRAFT_64420 [Leucosporidium creatinivorum]
MTEEAKNAKLWSDANAPAPTYSILSSASTSSASSSTSRLPPPAALSPGPALTILKRPTSAPSSSARSSASSGTPNTQKTLQQREREYEQARRRIYGEPPLPELESGVEALTLGGGGGNSSPSHSNGERGTRGPRSNPDGRSKSSGGSTRRRNGRGTGGGGAASSASSSSSLSLGPEKSAGGEKGGEGVVRAPKGPNAEGGFGFGGGSQGERTGSSSGRGRGRGR